MHESSGEPTRQLTATAHQLHRAREGDLGGRGIAGRWAAADALCGPGGYGKTQLALAVALEVVEEFEDGAWWVGLASLSDPDLVSLAVGSVLGARETPDRSPTEMLIEHLGARRTLLILDNCEHLVEASASLAEALLLACPNLRILATSREALNRAGPRKARGVLPNSSCPLS